MRKLAPQLPVKYLADNAGIPKGTLKKLPPGLAKRMVNRGVCEFTDGLPPAKLAKVSIAKPKTKAKSRAKKK